MNVLDKVREKEPNENTGDTFDEFRIQCKACGTYQVFIETESSTGCPTCGPSGAQLFFKCLACGKCEDKYL